MNVRRSVQSGVRLAHRLLSSPGLPRNLAIYFHELEPHQHGAFRNAIIRLKELGYTPCPPSQFIRESGGHRFLYISFDDNFASWFFSLPLLAELQLQCTFYVNTLPFADRSTPTARDAFFDRIAHRGDRRTLSTLDIAAFAEAGHVIGCHSHSHFDLASLARSQWDAEIRVSRDILQDLAGTVVSDFSYPYGMRRFFTPALAAYCKSLGFRTIATGIPGLQHAPRTDAHTIHRTRWNLDRAVDHNLADLAIDGRLFEHITGRSAVA